MKVIKWLDEYLEEAIISILLAIISVLMLFQFVLRPLGSSLSWSDETCRYMFVWMVGLGISYATKRSAHLRMDIVPTLIPKTQKFFELLCDLSIVAVSLWMFRPGLTSILGIMAKGQKGASTHVPMWIIYCSIETGFVLSIIRVAEKYIKRYLAKGKEA